MDVFLKNWDTDTPEEKRKTAFNKDVVALFAKLKPKALFQPGENHEYSNTGYVLLGHVIEKASGQPTHQFLQTEIFDKLGMKDSRAFTPTDKFVLHDRVYGFSFASGRQPHEYEENDWSFLNGMIGDGGIYASARDMLIWDQALNTEKLVSKKTLDLAFTSGKTNDGRKTGYGFGWIVESKNGKHTKQQHGGGWVGFLTTIVRIAETKRTVIVLTNNSAGAGFGILMRGLKNIDQGKLPPPAR